MEEEEQTLSIRDHSQVSQGREKRVNRGQPRTHLEQKEEEEEQTLSLKNHSQVSQGDSRRRRRHYPSEMTREWHPPRPTVPLTTSTITLVETSFSPVVTWQYGNLWRMVDVCTYVGP